MRRRMSRTQIYLQPELSEALDRLARKRGTSKANIIRMAARRFLQQEQDGREDPIFGLIGLGNAGHGRVSEQHDRILAEHGEDFPSR
ncbi:MAG TPA: CopG family transcriptional regulator [Chloroflexota bacterium]|nr:CopG family transcriptional regulator [Chloroflexota bacterium]